VEKRLIGSGCRLGGVLVLGRGIGELDGVEIDQVEGAIFVVTVGHLIVTNGDFVA